VGERSDLEFPSGTGACAAWVFRPGAVWVGLGERDITVSGKAIARLAARAPQAELHRYPYDHWQPYLGDAPARVAADQIDFLRRQDLLGA
jgi:hypothetical protein